MMRMMTNDSIAAADGNYGDDKVMTVKYRSISTNALYWLHPPTDLLNSDIVRKVSDHFANRLTL